MALWRRNENGKDREQPTAALPPPVLPAHAVTQKRDQQLNLKVSADCKRVFAEMQRVQGMSAAALFEDMVAERAEMLAKAGVLEV